MNLSKRAIETLWAEFADCPINDMEETLESFCGWPALTNRGEIWRWFDEQYALYGGVHALMFPDEHRKSRYGEVRAEVDLQFWVKDYAWTAKVVEFDCGKALDMIPIEKVEKLKAGSADYDTDDVFFEAVRMDLVEDHDGPFDCYILDEDELSSYIENRKKCGTHENIESAAELRGDAS